MNEFLNFFVKSIKTAHNKHDRYTLSPNNNYAYREYSRIVLIGIDCF